MIKKMNKRQYNGDSKSEYIVLLIGVLVIVTLIIGSILYMNYKICFPNNDVATETNSAQNEITIEQKAESTLLSTGLAIIGLAISVWAGLNIIQVLEKGKLDTLSKEVNLYRQERCDLNKRNFLNNILELNDTLNRHLYKMFSKIEDDNDSLAALYFECNKIELNFQKVYAKQNHIQRNIPVQYYKDTIEEIDRWLKEIINSEYKNKDVFIKYLKVRLAEFYFYLGYNVSADESISCFEKVIDYYVEVFEDLKNPELMMQKRYYLELDKELTRYMFNTMGEAYSKILQGYIDSQEKDENIDEIAKKLEVFYEYSIRLIEQRQNNAKEGFEVNYRNYGCALERINKYKYHGKDDFGDKEVFNKIKELYQKAIDEVIFIDNEQLREQTFHVYVSLYYKYMKYIGIIDSFKNNKAKLNVLKGEYNNLEKYTKEVDFYTTCAINIMPLNMYFWKIKTFVERDYTMWAIARNDKKKAKQHYEIFKEWWDRIEEAENRHKKQPDQMYKELEVALSIFQKHFDDM